MRLARLIALFLVSAALASLTSCSSDSNSDAVSRQDCVRLREHLIELRMASVTADQAQHRVAIQSALGDSFLSSCVEQTTESQLRCALAAADSDALVACNEPTTP